MKRKKAAKRALESGSQSIDNKNVEFNDHVDLFNQIQDLWDMLLSGKKELVDEIPESVYQDLSSIDTEMDILEKAHAEAFREVCGTEMEEPLDYVRNHKDEFSKEQIRFFENIEKLKEEIVEVQMLTQYFVSQNENAGVKGQADKKLLSQKIDEGAKRKPTKTRKVATDSWKAV